MCQSVILVVYLSATCVYTNMLQIVGPIQYGLLTKIAGPSMSRSDHAHALIQVALLKKFSDDVKALAGTKVQSGACI